MTTLYWAEETEVVCRPCLTIRDAEVRAIDNDEIWELRREEPIKCSRCGVEWVCHACANVGVDSVESKGCAVCGLLNEERTYGQKYDADAHDMREMDKYIEHLENSPEFNKWFEARRKNSIYRRDPRFSHLFDKQA